MNIAVDYGNSNAKVGIFEDDILTMKQFFRGPADLRDFLANSDTENLIVSSVNIPATDILAWSTAKGNKIALESNIPLPVNILYETPQTLGVDRIAAVCGAFQKFPGHHCLVIDAGTCINYEYLDNRKNYYGGAISPGIMMRFEAMSKLTARLPLVETVDNPPLIGTSTATCLQSGVLNGARAEITELIRQYRKKYTGIRILICGGDAHFFDVADGDSIFVFPDLVLTGLNSILRHSLSLH